MRKPRKSQGHKKGNGKGKHATPSELPFKAVPDYQFFRRDTDTLIVVPEVGGLKRPGEYVYDILRVVTRVRSKEGKPLLVLESYGPDIKGRVRVRPNRYGRQLHPGTVGIIPEDEGDTRLFIVAHDGAVRPFPQA